MQRGIFDLAAGSTSPVAPAAPGESLWLTDILLSIVNSYETSNADRAQQAHHLGA